MKIGQLCEIVEKNVMWIDSLNPEQKKYVYLQMLKGKKVCPKK
jgi:hypothetical protein